MSAVVVVIGVVAGLLLWLGGIVIVQEAPWWSRRLALGIVWVAATWGPPPKWRVAKRAEWLGELEFLQVTEKVPGVFFAMRFLRAGFRLRRRYWLALAMCVVGWTLNVIGVLLMSFGDGSASIACTIAGPMLSLPGGWICLKEQRRERSIPGPAVRARLVVTVTAPDGRIVSSSSSDQAPKR